MATEKEIPAEQLTALMRVLWSCVEKAGGTIRVEGEDAGPISGFMNVTIDPVDGCLTVSIKQDRIFGISDDEDESLN